MRQERFEEAIDVIRLLFDSDGEDRSHRGAHFELDRARLMPHGPDVESYVAAIRPYLEASFDELILHQIGPEQDGFLNFFAGELATALRECAGAHDSMRSRPS